MTMTVEKIEVRPAIETPEGVRCWCCRSMLAEVVTAPYRFTCRHCKSKNQRDVDTLTQ